jgi:copper resistance protein D
MAPLHRPPRVSGHRNFHAILPLTLLMFLLSPSAKPQDQPSHEGHAGMSMPMDAQSDDQPTPAELLSWKLESEFNHHLVGFFVLIAGLFILTQARLTNKLPFVRYIWPACFLLSGLFVLVYSDTELWPFGYKPWIQGVVSNPEVIQHKTFAVILLSLGFIEIARVRDHLRTAWAAWVFPLLAVAGSVMLLFHSHSTGMHGPDHMAIMQRIQSEHLSYAIAGVGIGLTKGFSEVQSKWQPVFSKAWPFLMMVLGVLLMFYTE